MAWDDGGVKMLKSLRLGTSHIFPKSSGWSLETFFYGPSRVYCHSGMGPGNPVS